jgi:hypothetical protein
MSALSLPPNLPPNWPGAGGSRANLGAAGIYYRALVGLFASAEKAAKLCSGLKAAGADCIIQKN